MNMQKWLKVGIAGLVTLLAVQGNGAPPPAGAYHGTVSRYTMFDGKPISTVCGTFSLNTTVRGRATAKVVLREQTLSFKAGGWEDAEGTPSVRMESRGGEFLVLVPFGSIEYMVGTLSGGSLGGEKMFIAATYHAFADQADAAAQAKLARLQGYYTVVLPYWRVLPRGDAEETPRGRGYLTMTVRGGGKVKIAGVLADGTKVSQASTLTTTPGVPFFRPLYRRRGEIGGLLKIDPDTRTVKVDWGQPAVYWDKLGSGPDGFQARLVPLGGYFIKGTPLPEPIGWLDASGNNVAYHLPGGPVMPQSVKSWSVTVTLAGTRPVVEKGVKPVLSGDGTHYVYTGNNSALATLRYSPLTGIFRGSFNQYYDYDSGGRLVHKVVKVPFAGVMYQWDGSKAVNGLGHYLIPETNPAFRALRIKRSFWIDLIYYD